MTMLIFISCQHSKAV